MEGTCVIQSYRPTTDVCVIEEPSNIPAVSVRSAWKSYGRSKSTNHVLSGLNMTVKLGNIYALLGASGCGKTTLLSCIIARKKLNSGEIAVFGYEPGSPASGVPGWRVGYMPQELALYKECDIREMFYFFGRIHALDNAVIEERLHFYTDLLQMPTSSRNIGSLSGGQQRRVSFSLALLHRAQLLILDEPTVGVDPILRQKIWDHMQSLTESSAHTIVITTHYIEEARQADIVGMMYCGKLLAEEKPGDLLQKHNYTRLEDVFYKYCAEHNPNLNEITATTPVQLDKKNDDVCNMSIGEKLKKSLRRSTAIYIKSLSRLIRSPIMFLFVVSMPPAALISFCIALSTEFKDLSLGVYNGEYPADPMCNPFKEHCFFGNLSCLYLDGLNTDMFSVVPFSSAEDAYKATLSRNVRASIIFPSNFSDSVQMRFASGTSIADIGTVKNARLSVLIDKSDMFLSTFMQISIMQRYIDFVKTVFESCEIDTALADMPVDVSDPFPENEDAPILSTFMGPLILLIVFFNTAFVGTVIYIRDRNSGVLDRIAVSGVTPLELIAALELTGVTIMVIQVVLVFATVFPIFGLPFHGGIPSIFLFIILQGIAGCIFGFLIGIYIPDTNAANITTLSAFHISLIFGGILWPKESLPDVINYINIILPLSQAVPTVRLLMVKTWSITSRLIWPGFAATTAWIVLFFILTVISVRKFGKF